MIPARPKRRPQRRIGVRDFVRYAHKRAGVPHHTTRAVMLAWKDFLTAALGDGLAVYQEHVGTFRLLLRRGRTTGRTIAGAPINHPTAEYVRFKATPKLKQAIWKQRPPTPN